MQCVLRQWANPCRGGSYGNRRYPELWVRLGEGRLWKSKFLLSINYLIVNRNTFFMQWFLWSVVNTGNWELRSLYALLFVEFFTPKQCLWVAAHDWWNIVPWMNWAAVWLSKAEYCLTAVNCYCLLLFDYHWCLHRWVQAQLPVDSALWRWARVNRRHLLAGNLQLNDLQRHLKPPVPALPPPAALEYVPLLTTSYL